MGIWSHINSNLASKEAKIAKPPSGRGFKVCRVLEKLREGKKEKKKLDFPCIFSCFSSYLR